MLRARQEMLFLYASLSRSTVYILCERWRKKRQGSAVPTNAINGMPHAIRIECPTVHILQMLKCVPTANTSLLKTLFFRIINGLMDTKIWHSKRNGTRKMTRLVILFACDIQMNCRPMDDYIILCYGAQYLWFCVCANSYCSGDFAD